MQTLNAQDVGMDEQHLAEEYVQDFVLDHLEDVTVKREEKRQRVDSDPWLQPEEKRPRLEGETWAPHEDTAKVCKIWPEYRRPPPLSPPPENLYVQQPVLVNMTLVSGSGTPPTPLPANPQEVVALWELWRR